MTDITTTSELKHYGIERRSGRYPWGSGDNPQRSPSFASMVRDLRKQGMSEKEVAESFKMKIREMRAKISIERSEIRKADSAFAQRLKDKGMSNVAIGQKMGINESSVRALLDPVLQERADIAMATADTLRAAIDKHKYIDIGVGVEVHLGISKTKLDTAIAILEADGEYDVRYISVNQQATGKPTSVKVLTKTETPYAELYANQDQIKFPFEHYTVDKGRTWYDIEDPVKISKDRIMVRYKEDGGGQKDGVIELRRGVKDLSLDGLHYAQVRIDVEGTHFMKGMAVYGDDMPKGIDIIYNANKPSSMPALGPKDNTVLKRVKDDPDNPFGAVIRQKKYIDDDGKEKLSALNLVSEEGDWDEWSRTLSSQVLSKQSRALAKKQLGIDADKRTKELQELDSLTNPAVKKVLLQSYADAQDTAAVDLKAAAMPGQSSHAILPVLSIKPSEVYAPNFQDGETVVLIRHPHGGTFEIPELKVNNKNPEAIRILGKDAKDVAGIHPSVASKLSGADFDGDSVLVIPNPKREIQSRTLTKELAKDLSDFDPKEVYKATPGSVRMTKRGTQLQMGNISNLITDMTIKGAPIEKIIRAVKHSMVVIDAEKHNLDYKKSAIDNGIAALKKEYQGSETGGTSTLISRAGSQERVPHRNDYIVVTNPLTGKEKRVSIDPLTGKKLYSPTGESYVKEYPNKRGPFTRDPLTGEKQYLTTRQKVIKRQTLTTKMAEKDDAFELSSGTPMETVYAEYANHVKGLGNKARKIMIETPDLEYSPSARKTYAKEVASLDSQLKIALSNKPLERQAQLLANMQVKARRAANPGMERGDLKKIRGQVLRAARTRAGAEKTKIKISDREWEAIQAGAISNNKLMQILQNTDLQALKQRALPHASATTLSPYTLSRARTMLANGQTRAQIANSLGISLNTLKDAL